MSMKNNSVRRAERREQAAIRQEEYDALTKEQKIARAMARRGRSKRELIRLNAWPDQA